MEVQAFTRRIGGDQHVDVTSFESPQHVLPGWGRHAAMDRAQPEPWRERIDRGLQGVAIFGEHHRRFDGASEQSLKAMQFRRLCRGPLRESDETVQLANLGRFVQQSRTRQPLIQCIVIALVTVVPGQAALDGSLRRTAGEQGPAASQRAGHGDGTRCHPARQRDRHQLHGVIRAAARLPDGAGVLRRRLEQRGLVRGG